LGGSSPLRESLVVNFRFNGLGLSAARFWRISASLSIIRPWLRERRDHVLTDRRNDYRDDVERDDLQCLGFTHPTGTDLAGCVKCSLAPSASSTCFRAFGSVDDLKYDAGSRRFAKRLNCSIFSSKIQSPANSVQQSRVPNPLAPDRDPVAINVYRKRKTSIAGPESQSE
jgi:hypothetical protein